MSTTASPLPLLSSFTPPLLLLLLLTARFKERAQRILKLLGEGPKPHFPFFSSPLCLFHERRGNRRNSRSFFFCFLLASHPSSSG